MNKVKYIARHKKSSHYVWAYEIDYLLNHMKSTIDDYDLYIDDGNGEQKIYNPREFLKKPKSLETLIYEMCLEKDELENSIATKDSELLQLKEELRQLKTNRDELKKWLKVCLEENNKIRLYDNNSYQAGEINTLENVIDKMKELERGKE